LDEAIAVGGMNRIMLDNFTPTDLKKAIQVIDKRFETEASGGITEKTIRAYAESVWIYFGWCIDTFHKKFGSQFESDFIKKFQRFNDSKFQRLRHSIFLHFDI